MNDEHLYAEVADELRNHGPVAGLWAKAFAESNGVESEAKALYLRYRVAQLAEAERKVFEAQKSADAEMQRLIFEREEIARKAQAKAEGITPIHLVLLGLILIMVISAIIGGIHA
jgi:hypothetical protein